MPPKTQNLEQKSASINVGEFTNLYVPYNTLEDLIKMEDELKKEMSFLYNLVQSHKEGNELTRIPDTYEKVTHCKKCKTPFVSDKDYSVSHAGTWYAMDCQHCTTEWKGSEVATKNFLNKKPLTPTQTASQGTTAKDDFVSSDDDLGDIPF